MAHSSTKRETVPRKTVSPGFKSQRAHWFVMLLGSMSNPREDLVAELARIIKQKFDFVEITIESPGARPERNWDIIRGIIERNKLKVVGSTDYHLQIASPWLPVRKAAISQIVRTFSIFEKLGAEFVTIHLDNSSHFETENMYEWNSQAIAELNSVAEGHGIKLMVENHYGDKEWMGLLRFVLKEHPYIYFNLDVGHANLRTKQNISPLLLRYYSKRLVHVHVSDNNGYTDEHLELGKGNINWKEIVKLLKRVGYDGTITLETFHPAGALMRSRKYFLKLWKEVK